MPINIQKTDQTVEFRNTDGRPCATYHYTDRFKSFFRGLYTPSGKDVVAPHTASIRTIKDFSLACAHRKRTSKIASGLLPEPSRILCCCRR
jgi:hypothetical protein